MATVSRREFLVSAAAGGGLLLAWHQMEPRVAAAAARATASELAPNAFVRIGSDGRITVTVSQVEMGQGTFTSMPMLLAEELEVGLDQVTVEQAPPDEKRYGLPGFGLQLTGASTSVRLLAQPLRQAGATARALLVAAAAQRWQVDPSTCRAHRAVVTHTPTGRTFRYAALADLAARLPVPEKVPLKDPKDFTLIGTPAKRTDGPAKVNGTVQFSIDVRLPGMRVATVAASPVVGGKLVSLDDSKAKGLKGVSQIVRLDDVVAVVAGDFWTAKRGLAALSLRWDDGPNATASTADVSLRQAAASLTPGVAARSQGDATAALARARKKIETTYEVPYLAHAALEPLSCTVHVRRDRCEVWVGSQILARGQSVAAEAAGLPVAKVVMHNLYIGGAFGRRLEVDFIAQAVRIAKHVEGPVKVIWTREEDMQHDVYRPHYSDRFAAAVDDRGLPVAWTHRIVGPSIYARFAPPVFKDGIDGDAVDGAVQLLYDIPSIRVEYVRHEEPVLPVGFWRGVGVTHNCFVVESFIDELAAAALKDPLAYRRALLGKSPRAVAVLDTAARASGWGRPLPAGSGRGVALLYSDWGTYLAQVAEVSVSRDGAIKVDRVVCAVDCGMVVNPDTVKAQIEGGVMFGIAGALWGEVTLDRGRVQQSNFHDYRVLRIDEAPRIEVHLVGGGDAPGGIGEPGTAVTAPAVANAVFAATGKRIRKLPLERQLRMV